MVKALVRSILSLTAIIPLLAILLVFPSTVLASPEDTAFVPERSPGNLGDEELSWFQWNDDVSALADDGRAIWLGTAMGVLRWDKTTGDVERYTTIDGLPSTHVFAAAVDGAGNRWFGGDGGLSRLDADGKWSHFSPDNSGMTELLVDGIAVGADGTLWVSHGLPDGRVSRLSSNGTWMVLPDISAMIMTDYQVILTTQNKNPLWLVSGDEVWMGFWVYDGTAWHDRSPFMTAGKAEDTRLPDASDRRPTAIDADSTGTVWTMVDHPEGGTRIRAWANNGWTDRTPYLCADAALQQLAIAGNDVVWIGYMVTYYPAPITHHTVVVPLSTQGCPAPPTTGGRPPVQVLLAAQEGVWAAGPGWLWLPSEDLVNVGTLALQQVTDVLVDTNDSLLVHSHTVPKAYGAIQVLDDQHTSTLNDDQLPGLSDVNTLTGWANTPTGDLIVTSYLTGGHGPISVPPERWRDGVRIVLDPGLFLDFYFDVFVQDDSHFWFAAAWDGPQYGAGVIGLDDRGTPLNPDDDTWRIVSGRNGVNPALGDESAVAVDSLNRIWYADPSGVYVLDGENWERKLDIPACDLVPGRWGVVNVILPYEGTSCRQLDMTVVIIDGSHIYARELEDFARSDAQYAPGSNRLWSVAPDGLVWYYWRPVNAVRSVVPSQGSRHSYPLPASAGPVSSIQAGSGSRIWIVAGDSLWRLAPQPEFSVPGLGGNWFLEAGGHATRRSQVMPAGTWNWPVSLETANLPPGITASLEPSTAQPGGEVTMTVQASPAAAPGSYPAQLVAQGGAAVQTLPLTITVAPQVYTKWLPLTNRKE